MIHMAFSRQDGVRLCLWLTVLISSARGMDVVIGLVGTDDALLSGGSVSNSLIEGADSCADPATCYVSVDALQSVCLAGDVRARPSSA